MTRIHLPLTTAQWKTFHSHLDSNPSAAFASILSIDDGSNLEATKCLMENNISEILFNFALKSTDGVMLEKIFRAADAIVGAIDANPNILAAITPRVQVIFFKSLLLCLMQVFVLAEAKTKEGLYLYREIPCTLSYLLGELRRSPNNVKVLELFSEKLGRKLVVHLIVCLKNCRDVPTRINILTMVHKISLGCKKELARDLIRDANLPQSIFDLLSGSTSVQELWNHTQDSLSILNESNSPVMSIPVIKSTVSSKGTKKDTTVLRAKSGPVMISFNFSSISAKIPCTLSDAVLLQYDSISKVEYGISDEIVSLAIFPHSWDAIKGTLIDDDEVIEMSSLNFLCSAVSVKDLKLIEVLTSHGIEVEKTSAKPLNDIKVSRSTVIVRPRFQQLETKPIYKPGDKITTETRERKGETKSEKAKQKPISKVSIHATAPKMYQKSTRPSKEETKEYGTKQAEKLDSKSVDKQGDGHKGSMAALTVSCLEKKTLKELEDLAKRRVPQVHLKYFSRNKKDMWYPGGKQKWKKADLVKAIEAGSRNNPSKLVKKRLNTNEIMTGSIDSDFQCEYSKAAASTIPQEIIAKPIVARPISSPAVKSVKPVKPSVSTKVNPAKPVKSAVSKPPRVALSAIPEAVQVKPIKPAALTEAIPLKPTKPVKSAVSKPARVASPTIPKPVQVKPSTCKSVSSKSSNNEDIESPSLETYSSSEPATPLKHRREKIASMTASKSGSKEIPKASKAVSFQFIQEMQEKLKKQLLDEIQKTSHQTVVPDYLKDLSAHIKQDNQQLRTIIASLRQETATMVQNSNERATFVESQMQKLIADQLQYQNSVEQKLVAKTSAAPPSFNPVHAAHPIPALPHVVQQDTSELQVISLQHPTAFKLMNVWSLQLTKLYDEHVEKHQEIMRVRDAAKSAVTTAIKSDGNYAQTGELENRIQELDAFALKLHESIKLKELENLNLYQRADELKDSLELVSAKVSSRLAELQSQVHTVKTISLQSAVAKDAVKRKRLFSDMEKENVDQIANLKKKSSNNFSKVSAFENLLNSKNFLK